QGVAVLQVVRVPEVPERVPVAGHALHQDVVVLTGLVVGPAGARFPVDDLGEVVEGAGVRARSVEPDLLGRPLRTDVAPGPDGRPGAPDPSQVVDTQACHEVVGRVHDHGHAVDRDAQLDVPDPRGTARLDLTGADVTRRTGEVGLARAKALEATARPGQADGDA